jgi:hypothetical protein
MYTRFLSVFVERKRGWWRERRGFSSGFPKVSSLILLTYAARALLPPAPAQMPAKHLNFINLNIL